jgi:hypothetical protein
VRRPKVSETEDGWKKGDDLIAGNRDGHLKAQRIQVACRVRECVWVSTVVFSPGCRIM